MKNFNSVCKSASKWLSGLFKDERGSPSSKRLVGVMCSITLCGTMYHNSFNPDTTAPASYLVDAVALLAFGCLGLSSIDKFTALKKNINSATSAIEKKEEPSICTICGQEPCTCEM